MRYNTDRIWHKLGRKSKSTTSTSDLPEPLQCTVHLRLSRAFMQLREEVVGSLRGQLPSTAQDDLTEHDLDDLVWQSFVCRAAERFEKWWRTLAPRDINGEPYHIDLSVCLEPGALEDLLRSTQPLQWTREDLPPLDILLVLHSYMLNPRCFLEDCIRYGMVPLWQAGMPWHLIDAAIDPDTNEYDVDDHTRNRWTRCTGLPWVSHELSAGHSNSSRVQLHKLNRAIQLLRCHGVPLPGTILGPDGLAQSVSHSEKEPDRFKLNRAMQGDLGSKVLFATSDDELNLHPSRTLQDVFNIIEHSLHDIMTPGLRKCLARTTLQIADTSSMFALDLASAVQRQLIFVRTMQEIDWLHSPFLDATLVTLLQRYRIFFHIMARHKEHVVVPTFAIDLAWHTHQLSPRAYYDFSVRTTHDVLIDHDDRISDSARDDAFAWTATQYNQLTARDYSACLCWHCVAAVCMLSPKTTEQDAESKLSRDADGHFDTTSRPRLAVEVKGAVARAQYERLQDDFAWACRRAEKLHIDPPMRDAFLKDYVWLYPHAIPVVKA